MSYIQLISDTNESSDFRVNFSDPITFKQNSKLALVSMTGFATFNIDMDRYLKDLEHEELHMQFKIGTGTNTITIVATVKKDDFNDYDIYNISLDDLLDVINDKISEALLQQCYDGLDNSETVYEIILEKKTMSDGSLGIVLLGGIDRKINLFTSLDDYKPNWGLNPAEKNNMNVTIPYYPKSQSDTVVGDPAYVVTEETRGFAMNGGYMRFNIETTDKTWTMGFSHRELTFTSTAFFDIDDADKTKIYAPIVLRCLGDDTGDGCTLELWQHNGDSAYSTSPDNIDNKLIGRFDRVEQSSLIEIWCNSNATILFKCHSLTGTYQELLCETLDMTYLFTRANMILIPPDILLYTTIPSIYPVSDWFFTAPYNFSDINATELYFFGWNTTDDKLFLPITWTPDEFTDLLGFFSGSNFEMTPPDDGLFTLTSTTNILSGGETSEKLNVHISNLPIVCHKNIPTFDKKTYNGFNTTLLRDIPIDKLGRINYEVVNLIYIDLKNPPENINDLKIEVRDATTNKITKTLSGTTIITLHLI